MDLIDKLYESLDGNPVVEEYMARHQIESAGILTVTDDEKAAMVTDYLRPRIEGKVVIEVGAGIGPLALHMASVASRVIAIEACPAWTHVFMGMWFAKKPPNLTFVFGRAEEVAMSGLRGEVALFCTHSGRDSMMRAARMLAPVAIDVYNEIKPLDGHPLEHLTR